MSVILRRALAGALLLATTVAGAQAAERIKVGISGGDAEIVWAEVKKVAARQGIDVQVVVFNDYTLPNAALDAGDLDANAFQHKPYLENQIRTKGYRLVAIGDTIVAPIGAYSRKVKSLDALKPGAQVGIPNDPSNGGRALLLLAAQKVVALRPGVGILPRVTDIVDNPRKLRIRELDAAQLPRSLDDLDVAVINTNYATQAGLSPRRDAIAIEATADNPYGNVIAVREKDRERPVLAKLVQAYQDPAIRAFILERFDGAMLPVW